MSVLFRSVLFRSGAFAATWWILSEGAWRGWPFGAAAVVVATAASIRVAPPRRTPRPRILGVCRLVGFFARGSIVGGIDVARRALDPRLPIAPGIVEVRLEHQDDRVRAGVVAVVSMLPGTVAATVGPRTMVVHGLDVGQEIQGRVSQAEHRVADALGLDPR
jgi:multicomponent Na+:H+ antiporter subunit E